MDTERPRPKEATEDFEAPMDFTSQHGFSVTWRERGLAESMAWDLPLPGIKVQLWKPDQHLKEERVFTLDKRAEALQAFQGLVAKITSWDKIK